MTSIVVTPLARIAEMAVRHRAREMISLMAKEQSFHRPAVIEAHVREIIDFAAGWDQTAPLIVHCWMGVSRSPAAAVIAALSLRPDQSEETLAQRLRAASPYATPNMRIIEIGDHLLGRDGRLVKAIKAIGRGADADGNAPFVLALDEA
jgi:predicted protein tyrosine phosphatase